MSLQAIRPRQRLRGRLNGVRTIRRGQFGANNSALDNSARQFVADNSAQNIILILHKIPLLFSNIFRQSRPYFSNIFSSIQLPFQQFFHQSGFHFSDIFSQSRFCFSSILIFSSILQYFVINPSRFHLINITFSFPLPFQQQLFINLAFISTI